MSSSLIEAENEFFLGLYRSAVRYYQPKIEKRTGYSLGEIRVRDFRQLIQDQMRNVERAAFRSLFGLLLPGLMRTRLKKSRERLDAAHADRADRCSACYYDNTIYVSLGDGDRGHDRCVALTTVHELSHALWERIEGKPLHSRRRFAPGEIEKFEILGEGFATYAGCVLFKDFYSAHDRRVASCLHRGNHDIYSRGLQSVTELVTLHGPQVFLEIPKRWKSFAISVAKGTRP